MKKKKKCSVRGLAEKFVDTIELVFKYGCFQFLIVHRCESVCYE